MSNLYYEVEAALQEANERIADLSRAQTNHDRATAALVGTTATLGRLAELLAILVDEQRRTQDELARVVRAQSEAAKPSEHVDALARARVEGRMDQLLAELRASSAQTSQGETLARLEAATDGLAQRLAGQEELLANVTKLANAHITSKVVPFFRASTHTAIRSTS